jgi:hypothetical protein
MLVRLVTRCSWVDAERLVGGVSDTTLRIRRDEWSTAGVFERLAEMMLGTYNEAIGLHCAELSRRTGLPRPTPGGLVYTELDHGRMTVVTAIGAGHTWSKTRSLDSI